MKTLFLFILLAVPLAAQDRDNAAFTELDNFAYDHGLFWGAEQFDVGDPWIIDLIWNRMDDKSVPPDKRIILWEESGYRDARQAVDRIEQDYKDHPEGYKHVDESSEK